MADYELAGTNRNRQYRLLPHGIRFGIASTSSLVDACDFEEASFATGFDALWNPAVESPSQ
jgi:hypothetical protein